MPNPPSPLNSGPLRSFLIEVVGNPMRAEPIEAGTCGTSWRVETERGQYAVKIFRDDAEFLLGPAEQFRLLEAIAPADISPAPIAGDDRLGVLVTQWITDGRPAVTGELADPSNICTLASLLGKLHAVDCAVPRYRPTDYLTRYVDALGGRDRMSASDRKRHDELLDLDAGLRSMSDALVLCHNDLTADNCFLGARLRLIDFDFAALASPLVDLASVAEMNEFDDVESRLLLAAYYDGGGERWAEFVSVRRLVQLLAHFWALAATDAGAVIVAQYRIEDD